MSLRVAYRRNLRENRRDRAGAFFASESRYQTLNPEPSKPSKRTPLGASFIPTPETTIADNLLITRPACPHSKTAYHARLEQGGDCLNTVPWYGIDF
jgi:hypothetical protein